MFKAWFEIMWGQELTGSKNGITLKMLYLCKDRAFTYGGDPLNRCRKGAVWSFVVIELVGFGATFAITQTIAAIGWVLSDHSIRNFVTVLVFSMKLGRNDMIFYPSPASYL